MVELIKFTVLGSLPSLNEYVNANRRNRYAGAKMKQDAEILVEHYIKLQGVQSIESKFELQIDWYEKDNRKDADNVASATKFLLDSMAKSGVIKNDSRKYLTKISHEIFVDKVNPRIEVTLISV